MMNFKTEKREQNIEKLNELIHVTRDGAEFYSDAAKSVDNPKLKILFEHMASSKQGLVGAMSREVRDSGATPAGSGTLRGTLHQFYTDIRATLRSKDSDYAYVSELEAAEDRIMDAFHKVLKDSSTPESTKETVMGYLPKVKAQHDAMRDRKWQMQADQRH
jgi:uncharacterized protein (TIGR02284 family)